MVTRREFIEKSAIGISALTAAWQLPPLAAASRANASPLSHFKLRSFIEDNPNAVFIVRTNVPNKLDEAATEKAGTGIANLLFEPSEKGWRADAHVVIKPNLVGMVPGENEPPELSHGVVTNPHFLGGFIDGMRTLGPSDYTVLERAGHSKAMQVRGYKRKAREKKFDLIDFRRPNYKYYADDELNWRAVRNGYVLKEIPTLRPVLDDNSMLIYMPTFKAHNLGILTLSCKGQQGLIPQGYGEFCIRLEGLAQKEEPQLEHFRKLLEIQAFIKSGVKQHAQEGYFRWDSHDSMDELWVHYTLEAISAIRPDLCIIEGIVGRDGNAFGIGADYLYNVIIFGLNPLYVDMIGHYLGGHHPWNVGLFRIARERGIVPTVIPGNIDVYEIEGNKPTLIESIDEWGGKYPLACSHHSDSNPNPATFVFLNQPVTDAILKGENFSRGFNFEMQKTGERNDSVRFSYETERAGNVHLALKDSEGRTVMDIVNRHQSSGRHSVEVDRFMMSENEFRGSYVACLSASGRHITRELYI